MRSFLAVLLVAILSGCRARVEPPVRNDAPVPMLILNISVDEEGRADARRIVVRSFPPSEFSPCASEAQLRAARQATLPPPGIAQPMEPVTAQAILTTLDIHSHELCSRLVKMNIEEAVEYPPTPDGRSGWGWARKRENPFWGLGDVEVNGVAAIRISGWRGVKERTMPIVPLLKRPKSD
jgi:hypothetical protein